MSATIQTRRAQADDLRGISHAITECGLFSAGEAEGVIASLSGQVDDPDHHWLVAERVGGIVGAAYLTLDAMSRDVFNLWFIGLPRTERRRGGGRALMRAAEVLAGEAGGRLLLVETSGGSDLADTRAFYDALDYREAARIADYYAPGEAKVIYARSL